MRPTQPLPERPGGYFQLESYSSLKRLWNFLEGAQGAGRRVRLQRGDPEERCRRIIEGYTLERAGFLLDEEKARTEDEITLHPALLALASGDTGPLKQTLSEHYALSLTFALALTRSRALILKGSGVYVPLKRPEIEAAPVPLEGGGADGLEFSALSELEPASSDLLPTTARFYPRRLSKDEWRVMLERACGFGAGQRPL